MTPTGITHHLAPEPVWEANRDRPGYLPEAFASEGFIHTTNDETHLLDVANRSYRDDHRPYLLLDVDLAKVTARVVNEDAARRYPHVYGPIERAAVVRVRRMVRDPDGTFLAAGADYEPGHSRA